ncbi:hypothetical protein D0A23_05970 [Bacillus amyloliquefaciens]|nr:hypothetical protein D0A23_05970 [Bacillus amyloliquefaciens]
MKPPSSSKNLLFSSNRFSLSYPFHMSYYAISIHEGDVLLLKTHEFVNILNPKPYLAIHKKNALSPDR